MIEILTDVPPGVVGVRARGTLTREEYDDVVVPMLDEAHRTGRRLRILCEVGADYTGLTPGAMWEDLRLGTRALHLFDGCAVEVRHFAYAALDDAIAWAGAAEKNGDGRA